jgi:YggT family protein
MVLNAAITVLIVLIFIEVIIANFMAFGRGLSPYHPAVRTLRKIVNPILDPFRRMLPPSRTGGWDFSPMLVMILLYLVRNMLSRMH